MSQITDYVISVGGPIALVSTGMFYLLKQYVKERIKSDFAEQIEQLKHANQKELEQVRAEIGARLEQMKSSLGVAQSAASHLIQRRLSAYEDVFQQIDTYMNALIGVQRVHALQMSSDANKETILFYDAASDFDRIVTRYQPFISSKVYICLSKLGIMIVSAGQKVIKEASLLGEEGMKPILTHKQELESFIRDDLVAILETGTITFPDYEFR